MPDYVSTYISPTIRPSGTTFAQLQAGGLSAVVENVLAANPPLNVVPAKPTVDATGGGATGGTLPAGVYTLKIAASNGLGETAASPASASFTVAAGNKPSLTLPALPAGAGSWSVYLTPPGGAAGTETLFAEGLPAGNFVLSTAVRAGARLAPTTDTTGFQNDGLAFARACERGKLQTVYDAATTLVSNFHRGDPIVIDDVLTKLRVQAAALKVVVEAIEEAAALIHGNTGTVKSVVTSPGRMEVRRTFP